MKALDWKRRAAKRMVAEDALRRALAEIETVREIGGAKTSVHATGYMVARHLAQHAAEQLRLSDGE